MVASREGHTESQKVLLEAGADFNLRDEVRIYLACLHEMLYNCMARAGNASGHYTYSRSNEHNSFG